MSQNTISTNFQPPEPEISATLRATKKAGKGRARVEMEDGPEPEILSGGSKLTSAKRGGSGKEPDFVSNDVVFEESHTPSAEKILEDQPGVQDTEQGKLM